MIADKTSGEIVLSTGAENAHEILFDIDSAEACSIGWRFDVLEGLAVEFSMHVLSRSIDHRADQFSPLQFLRPEFSSVESFTMKPASGYCSQRVRDCLVCSEDEGVFQIADGQGRLMVVFRWSVPSPTKTGYFARLFGGACMNQAVLDQNTILRHKIEIKERHGPSYEDWTQIADRSFSTGAAIGLGGMVFESMSDGMNKADDLFCLDPVNSDEQQMMTDLQDDVIDFFNEI